MITHQDWLTDNLEHRLTNPSLDYTVYVRPYKFKELNFNEAARATAKMIHDQHDQLYLALSGGMDSEFMVRCFKKLRIPFKVIIGACSANEVELLYAYDLCQQLKIKPIVVRLTDPDILQIFQNQIIKKFNGTGIYTVTSLAVAAEVAARGGTLVTGKNIIGEGSKPTNEVPYNTNEWDSYASVLYGNDVGFYTYTPELTYSMLAHPADRRTWQEYKSGLYQIRIREKVVPQYSTGVIRLMQAAIALRPAAPKAEFIYGGSEAVRALLGNYRC